MDGDPIVTPVMKLVSDIKERAEMDADEFGVHINTEAWKQVAYHGKLALAALKLAGGPFSDIETLDCLVSVATEMSKG